jgi:hypothetical protein
MLCNREAATLFLMIIYCYYYKNKMCYMMPVMMKQIPIQQWMQRNKHHEFLMHQYEVVDINKDT